MVQESFTTTILKASDDSFLTQAEDIDIKERILAKVIALGRYDSADNWKEISKEEAQEYDRLRKQALDDERNKE